MCNLEPSPEPTYKAYLVRLWRENGAQPWRVMVEEVQTGKRLHFDTIEAYIAHVCKQTDAE